MGTRYHIAWLPASNTPAPEQVHQGVEAILEEINASMSTYREDSEISRFNRAPLDQWISVSEDFAEVFAMARKISQASAGAYDVTVGPLVNLWGFGPEMGDTVPDPERVSEALDLVGESRLEFDQARPAIRKSAAQQLDFSSIAKGYGVDRLAQWLEQHGIADYLVEIGGEIRVGGKSPRGDAWRIAVERPMPEGREMVAAVQLENASVATSGDYRNFFEVDGMRYSHSIDPRTGAPVRHELVSVTVVHASAAIADGWATALVILGPELALATAVEEELAVYLISRHGEEFEMVSSPAMAPLLGID